MDLLFTSFFWVTLAEIVMINIMLSGDNAVVIALASRSLPPKQQKLAVLYGSFGAVVLRIILTFFAVVLLDFPMLKIVGAVLLVWIGIKMLIPEVGEAKLDAHDNLLSAIKTIIVADLIMSLDNVLGVAAAAKGNTALLVIGLAMSIPLIVYGSTLILKLMERFGFIVTLGGGLLGWIAGEMLVTDPMIASWVSESGHWAHTMAPMTGAALVMLTGYWFASAAARNDAVLGTPDGLQFALDGAPAPVPDEEPLHEPRMEAFSAAAADAESFEQHTAPVMADLIESEAPPPGYRWVTKRWRMLPGGVRDYAALHGLTTFRSLAPVSSRIRSERRNWQP